MSKVATRPAFSKTIVILFSALIIVDLAFAIIFVRYSDNLARAKIIQLNIHDVIALVSDLHQNKLAMDKVAHHKTQIDNITLTMTKKPVYRDLHLDRLSLWELYQYLRHHYIEPMHFSYQLANNKWLNFVLEVTPHFSVSGLILIFVALLITFIILSYAWSVEKFTQVLTDITDSTKQLGLTLKTQRLPVYGPNIVRGAITSLNHMQTRIRELLHERLITIAALSHDIKTPLTRIQLRMQLHMPEEEQERCAKDFTEIESLLKETFEYAKQNFRAEPHVKLDLLATLHTMVYDLQDLGKTISLETALSRVIVVVQVNNIKRAISNIISNAFSYAGSVWLHLSVEQQQVVITIEDDGPGIPEAKLEKVFTAFYRQDSSRSRNTGGAGLGLAIAKKIIEEHEGEISLNNRKQGGLCVTITMPCVDYLEI